MNWKKLALRAVLNKAKELYKKGNTVDEIALKFWAEPKIAAGLNAVDVSTDDLINMIKDKVGDKGGDASQK